MMILPIAHFENKRNFFVAFNGGKLFVTDSEYIIKWSFFVIARFPKEKTEIAPAPDSLIGKGFYFKSGKKIWELRFSPKNAENLSGFLNL